MGQTNLDPKFAYWMGIPRETIDWHPTIDESKCIGCGMCVVSCGRKVFDYNWEKSKAVVARELQCLVGCSSCEAWCVADAISFPDKKYVKDLIKEHKVLVLAKRKLEELKEKGEI